MIETIINICGVTILITLTILFVALTVFVIKGMCGEL